MPMGLKFCQCRFCRDGNRSRHYAPKVARAARSLRLRARDDVRKGRELVTDRVSIIPTS